MQIDIFIFLFIYNRYCKSWYKKPCERALASISKDQGLSKGGAPREGCPIPGRAAGRRGGCCQHSCSHPCLLQHNHAAGLVPSACDGHVSVEHRTCWLLNRMSSSRPTIVLSSV